MRSPRLPRRFQGSGVVAATATTVLLWASAYALIRVALADLDAAALSIGRLLVASAVLLGLAWLGGVRRPATRDLQRIVWCGATGMTAYQLLLNTGERTVDAGTASFLINTGPVLAALIAFVFLRERISRRSWVGIVVGCVGGTVIAFSQGKGLAPTPDALLVLGAAAAQATFFVIQKPLLERYSGLEVTCYATWSGTALALPLAPTLLDDLPHASPTTLLAVVLLGVGPSAVGYATWAYVQSRAPIGVSSNSLYLVPFVATGLSWLLLAEMPSRWALVGGAVAVAGVAISRSRPRHHPPRHGRPHHQLPQPQGTHPRHR